MEEEEFVVERKRFSVDRTFAALKQVDVRAR
jgi:hypothetical protein